MSFSVGVERWRAIVVHELGALSSSVPPEIILGIIKHESNGNPDAFNKKSEAAGLMQIKPIALDYYNTRKKKKLKPSDILGSDNAENNIMVGCFLFEHYIERVEQWFENNKQLTFPDEESHIKFALYSYSMGFGDVQKKLDELKDNNFNPITSGTFNAQYPAWGWKKGYWNDDGEWIEGRWLNRPLHYADTVYSYYQTYKPVIEIEVNSGERNQLYLAAAALCGVAAVISLIIYFLRSN